MALISIIFSLLIERYLGTLREFRDFRWFDDLTDRFRELIPELARHPRTAVVLLLLLPALGVLIAFWLLAGIWSLLAFGFALAVLLYSYGCQDLEPQIEAFIDARLRGDNEAARFHLFGMLQVELPEDPRELTRSLIETVLVEMNERLLSVIFWFFLLGPAGALAFRLSSILKYRFREETSGFGAAAQKVHHWLGWAPARLTAISYALMGNFTESVRYRREETHHWAEENRGILVASGLGALQYPLNPNDAPASRMNDIADLRSTIELLRRVIVVWVIAIGALTVIGASISWILG